MSTKILITLRVSPEQLDRFKYAAAQAGLSLNEFGVRALEQATSVQGRGVGSLWTAECPDGDHP